MTAMANFIENLHMKALLRYMILLAFLPTPRAWAQAEAYMADIPTTEGPLEVRMGFTLSNITDVNEKDETIDIDGALFLRWKDERLAYEPGSVGYPENYQLGDYSLVARKLFQGDYAVKETFFGWRPYLIIQNGIGDRIKTAINLGIWPDGTVLYSETFHSTVETPMDLRLFPFDRQELQIHVLTLVYGSNQLILVPDDDLSITWEHKTGIAQWKNEGFSYAENTIEMESISGKARLKSEFVASIHIKRMPQHFLLSIILPLVILVCLSWIVFWMDEEATSDRINVSFIGILSVVAYYFVIQDSIPSISYITLIDCFIILTFVILAATVIISIVVDKLNKSDREHVGDRIDRISRWAFPSFYFSMSLLITLVFFMVT